MTDEPRTLELELAAPYEGWRFTARLDFPARYLEEMQSGDILRVCRALDRYLVLEHNFPDMDGAPAASMLDVYPVEGVLAALAAYQRETGALPNP